MDSMLVRSIYTASRAKVKCVESGKEVGEADDKEEEEEEAEEDAMLWWTQKQVHDPRKQILALCKFETKQWNWSCGIYWRPMMW